jgi:hypothetical protein
VKYLIARIRSGCDVLWSSPLVASRPRRVTSGPPSSHSVDGSWHDLRWDRSFETLSAAPVDAFVLMPMGTGGVSR